MGESNVQMSLGNGSLFNANLGSRDIRVTYGIDLRGGTDSSDPEVPIRNLIEQILFAVLGERVNWPKFGTGLDRLP